MPWIWWTRCRHYLVALRPWSFSASLTPVLMGCVLAYKTTEAFSLVTLLATLLTVVSVHAAGNLVNTYCDFMRGIDSKRRSDDRTLVDHILTPEEVVNLGMTTTCETQLRLVVIAILFFRSCILYNWLHWFCCGCVRESGQNGIVSSGLLRRHFLFIYLYGWYRSQIHSLRRRPHYAYIRTGVCSLLIHRTDG